MHIQYAERGVQDSPVTNIKFFELNETSDGFAGIQSAIVADETKSLYTLNELNDFNTNGRLKGYIEGYGYKDAEGNLKGTYNDMLSDLDEMAYTFATHFNLVHSKGWSLNEIQNKQQNANGDFFTVAKKDGAASSIVVSKEILEDVEKIAAAGEGNIILER